MAFYCIPRRRRHHRTNPAKREGTEGSLIKKGERSGGSPRGKGVTHGICRRYRNRGSSGRHPGGDGPGGTPGGRKQERTVGTSIVRRSGSPDRRCRPDRNGDGNVRPGLILGTRLPVREAPPRGPDPGRPFLGSDPKSFLSPTS